MSEDKSSLEYQFAGKLNRRMKKLCERILNVVPELAYIDKTDFDIIIAIKPSPTKQGQKVIATMEYVGGGWEIQYIEWISEKVLPPFMMVVYPIFFKHNTDDRIKILMHEMFHINERKSGIRPHTGFGDEVIFNMHKANLEKLRSLK